MEPNENNESNKRGRGRPKGSKNVISKNINLISKNKAMSSAHIKNLINLFVIGKFSKMDTIFEALSDRDKGKMMLELMKFSTTTASTDAAIASKTEDVKKDISSIRIVYENPNQLEQTNTIDITPHEDVQDEDVEDSEDDDINESEYGF